MNNQQPSSHPIIDSIVSALPGAIVSGVAALLAVSFSMGNARSDLSSIASTQTVQSQQINTLVERFSTIDKNQAVLATRIENMSNEINRLNQGWANLNEDMKCIRMVAASKGGDITKC